MLPRTPLRLVPGFIVLSLFGCGGSPHPAAATAVADPHGFDPCGAESAGAMSCEDWATWPRINAETFRSGGHQKAWVDVHVDPRFEAAYRAGVGPMPVGLRIVKAAHADDAGAPGAVTGLTVMAKMEPGYDPDNGDWFYGIYDAGGTVASKQGTLPMCIGCHVQWSEHDYLGGVPGLWER